MTDNTTNPPHYTFGKFEVIEVLEDWFAADPLLWQVGKYISRAGRKGEMLEDLKKAQWYLERKIASVEGVAPAPAPAPSVDVATAGFSVGDEVSCSYRDGHNRIVGNQDRYGAFLLSDQEGVHFRCLPQFLAKALRAEKQISPAEEVDRIRGKK